MPNQHDFQRIVQNVIQPLALHWQADLEQEAIKDYVEDLFGFHDETLIAALRSLRRESRRCPNLASIYAKCQELQPPPPKAVPSTGGGYHCRGHAEIEHPQIAARILATPEGQKALELGCAISLLIEYEKTGRTEFDMSYVHRIHQATLDSARELAKAVPSPITTQLENLWNSMQEREKRAYQKFYKAALAA